jgi:arylsulfatase A-like enzyme
LVLLVACYSPSNEVPQEGPSAPDLGLEQVFESVPGSLKPLLFLPRVPFAGKLAVPEVVVLDQDYTLEFIPFLDQSAPDEDRSLRTYLEVSGETILLSSDSVVPWKAKERRPVDPFAAATHLVRIDLSPYRGRTVGFRWVLGDPAKQVRGALARLRVRAAVDASSRRPDVLLVCSDTHRYDFAFGAGSERWMPALHRLQEDSIVYQQGFSNASWTMPAIASALTGLFPRYHRSGQLAGVVSTEEYDAAEVPPGQFAFLLGKEYRLLTTYSERLRSLSDYLKDAGYTSVLIGSNPLYFLSGLAFDGSDLAINTGVVEGSAVNAAAFEVLERIGPEEPLFLLVHYMNVHHWEPWYFSRDFPKLRKVGESRGQIMESYAHAVADTDRHLDALLGRWAGKRDWEQSLVVFYADHGEQLLDPESPMLGHGNTMNDLLLHVPLMVKYPRSLGVQPGLVKESVSLADLAPTILTAAGIQYPPAAFSGISLTADAAQLAERELYADYQLWGEPLSTVRRGRYKLIVNLENGMGTLLDLRSGEVIDDGSEENVRRELMKAFRDYRDQAEAKTAELTFERVIDQEEALQQLKALGYVE